MSNAWDWHELSGKATTKYPNITQSSLSLKPRGNMPLSTPSVIELSSDSRFNTRCCSKAQVFWDSMGGAAISDLDSGLNLQENYVHNHRPRSAIRHQFKGWVPSLYAFVQLPTVSCALWLALQAVAFPSTFMSTMIIEMRFSQRRVFNMIPL